MVIIRLVDLVELASHPGMIQTYAAPAQSIVSLGTHKHDNSYPGFRNQPKPCFAMIKEQNIL
jgi:hypothetical protein